MLDNLIVDDWKNLAIVPLVVLFPAHIEILDWATPV